MNARVFVGWIGTVLVVLLLLGCAEIGDKPIASGEGLGEIYKAPAGSKQMRIAIENYFTRRVTVEVIGAGKHYHVLVGPIRKRHIIVPEGKYEVKAWTEERSTGGNYLHVTPFTANGMNGLSVRIRF
jgi:hypothetical protein